MIKPSKSLSVAALSYVILSSPDAACSLSLSRYSLSPELSPTVFPLPGGLVSVVNVMSLLSGSKSGLNLLGLWSPFKTVMKAMELLAKKFCIDVR